MAELTSVCFQSSIAMVLILLAFFSQAIAVEILHLNEGDICKTGPPPSYCKLHSQCPGIQEALKKRPFPEICSFKGRRNPVVCCNPAYAQLVSQPVSQPVPQPSGSTSKAQAKCKEYAEYVYKNVTSFFNTERRDFCGQSVEPLIVKGEPARPREFPHMARIGYGNEGSIEWLCGGSLISERFVLSAAHCTEPKVKGLARWVNLGDLDVSTDNDEAEPVTIKIIQRINHPNYDSNQFYHDIALYKLEKDAPLGIYIRPICLNTEKITNPRALASGWGRVHWGFPESPQLLKVKLEIRDNKKCTESYQPNIGPGKELPNGITNFMLCAGGVGEADTCQGDSGGPLQVPLVTPYCMYSIIGVTSFGKRCGYGFPGVYTNVALYIKWIEDNVWP